MRDGMSVEEVRADLWETYEWCGRGSPEYLRESLDRLILEVRAEMPCSQMCRCGAHETEPWFCGNCPSCEARAKLEQAKVMT